MVKNTASNSKKIAPNPRSSRFTLFGNYQFDIHDKDGNVKRDISIDDWKAKVIAKFKKNANVEEAFLVFHDKDVDPDDATKLKGIHWHAVIKYPNAHWANSVRDDFDIAQENDLHGDIVARIRKPSGAYRYLTHTSDESMKKRKWRYGLDELICFVNGERVSDLDEIRARYTERIAGTEIKDDSTLKGTIDLLITEIKLDGLPIDLAETTLTERFGSEGAAASIRNSNVFEKAHDKFLASRARRLANNHFKRVTTYVFGKSGVGKSLFIKQFTQYLAEREGYRPEYDIFKMPAQRGGSSSIDMLSLYNGEPISITDEIPGERINFNTFLTVFAPDDVMNIDSRYNAKAFVSNRCFVIKDQTPHDFMSAIIKPETFIEPNTPVSEIEYQVTRRIAFAIQITEGNIFIYKNANGSGFNDKYSKRIRCTKADRFDNDKLERINKALYEYLYVK